MLEIIKTLLVSLVLAATGAGIAWSVSSSASMPLDSLLIESGSNQGAKSDRLDIPSTKADRLPVVATSRKKTVVVVVHAESLRIRKQQA